MKFKISREWLQKRAARDDKAEVSTGALSLDQLIKETNALRQTPYEQERLASAFGWLIRSRRLEKGLSIDRLVQKAEIDATELQEIENNIHYTPEPRTVHQLAKILNLPERRLMQLCGHLIVTDSGFTSEVERFAARAKRADELTDDQHQVLREFVRYLAGQH